MLQGHTDACHWSQFSVLGYFCPNAFWDTFVSSHFFSKSYPKAFLIYCFIFKNIFVAMEQITTAFSDVLDIHEELTWNRKTN